VSVLPKINICRSILQSEEDEVPILKGCCRNPAFPGYWDPAEPLEDGTGY